MKNLALSRVELFHAHHLLLLPGLMLIVNITEIIFILCSIHIIFLLNGSDFVRFPFLTVSPQSGTHIAYF